MAYVHVTEKAMKNYRPRRPRGPLAVAAFVLSALTLSLFALLPIAVESHVPEFRVAEVVIVMR
jgi:hypothetical protein